MRTSLLLLFADPILWSSLWGAVIEDEFSSGRTYVLNPQRLSWEVAAQACTELGGNLATLRSFSTIPNIDLDGDWTFWIGLTRNEGGDWGWMDSSSMGWSNWRSDYLSSSQTGDDPCAVAVTMLPYWWQPRNCSAALPSLCELQEGDCMFVVFNHSSVISNNMKFVPTIALEDCQSLCEEEQGFVCRSFEYNSGRNYCMMSSVDRYTPSISYTEHDPELDYYHRTCDSGRLREGFTVSPIGVVTEEITTTPLPTTTDMSSDLVCVKRRVVNPNVTEPMPEEVKELKSMKVVFQARQTELKRTSIADYRPSANYVGSTAVIIAFSIVGSVVICDLASLIRRIVIFHKKMRRRRKKHSRYSVAMNGPPLRITDHMNAVTRHMQFLSQNNIETKSSESNGDCLSNAEVLSEHSFSRINCADVGENKIQNGAVSRDKASRTYDWSESMDNSDTRDILAIELQEAPESESIEENDLNKSSNSSKYIYRPYYSTNL